LSDEYLEMWSQKHFGNKSFLLGSVKKEEEKTTPKLSAIIHKKKLNILNTNRVFENVFFLT